MAKTLDFNKLNRPTLQLVMMDDAQTSIKVGTPSEVLIEEMQAALPELQSIMSAGDKAAVECCYDLAARLINHNYSGVTMTGEELRSKYRLGIDGLVIFFNAYLDFIHEITNAKN